ncbi:MAG: hypothetical protein J6C53_03680 [Clostridia bacterium]|nr:hypothetical protein [Clostridia bacterium]
MSINILMQERKEKYVLIYLCKVCTGKTAHLISPHDIAKEVCKKVVLSVSEIDEIMASLSLQNYIDFVVSDSRNGYYYCVKLKKKGQTYLTDSKKQKKALLLLVLRSMFLASVSFVFGVILKAIFQK